MALKYTNHLVIITGHSSGLGRALAKYYLSLGWSVLGLSRRRLPDMENLFQVAMDLSDNNGLVDFLNSDEWRQYLCCQQRIILFNNAGVTQPNSLVGHQDMAELITAVGLNLTAAMLLTQAVLHDSHDDCLKDIVYISSGAGRKCYPGWSVYGATKAALDQYAKILASENHINTRVLSIAPGVVDTKMQEKLRLLNPELFPAQPRFQQLYQNHQLQTPELTASCIAEMVEYADNQQICCDVREKLETSF